MVTMAPAEKPIKPILSGEVPHSVTEQDRSGHRHFSFHRVGVS